MASIFAMTIPSRAGRSVEERQVCGRPAFLQLEQSSFPVDSTAVPGELSAGADHAVARDDDGDGIVAVGQSHGACGAGGADLVGDFPVGPGFPYGIVSNAFHTRC